MIMVTARMLRRSALLCLLLFHDVVTIGPAVIAAAAFAGFHHASKSSRALRKRRTAAPRLRQRRNTPFLFLATSSSSEAPSSYGLYEVQEEMLVKRGIYEEELMNASKNCTPLKASKPKGVGGTKKGFGGSSSSSSSSSKSRFHGEAAQHAAVLRKEGVVRIDNVLPAAVADRMREFVLQLRQDSLDLVANGTLKNHSDRFADVLLRSNRCDLKLPLGDVRSDGGAAAKRTPVMEALHSVLCQSAVKDTVAALMSDQAVLYELSCMISDPGSQRQVMHPDNPYLPGRDDPTLLTCFIALQDVDITMGPTVFLPRTHTAAQHAIFMDEAVSQDGDSDLSPKDALLRSTKSVLGTLTKGSCALYDSRLLHCGSANRSLDKSRAIFYFSFRNPEVAYPGNPASIRADLSAARISLQDLTNAIIATHENGLANPFAY